MTEVAHGIYYPPLVHYDDNGKPPETKFTVIQNNKGEYYLNMDMAILPSKEYNFGDRQRIDGFRISKKEYEKLSSKKKGWFSSTEKYKKTSLIDRPCPGEFLITFVKEDKIGGMKRKTNKRKRKNAGKSRKHK
jgi:hypothetical protein